MKIPWFCLMGPTASGKTALACELIQHFPFEIISIDSAMIYKGLNVGAAKPDKQILTAAPHHLIDIISPEETYSVAECYADVLQCGQAIESRGHIPLLVGGTMMYFHALQQGLSPLPASDPELRKHLMDKAQTLGWDKMYQYLQEIDSVYALRIHPHDKQRLLRAIEVYELTKKPLSQWFENKNHHEKISYVNFRLLPEDRGWLHTRIAERFKEMLVEGLIEEVQTLKSQWSLSAEHSSMRCVGYRQVWDYLHDHHSLSLLMDKGVAATRQVAKRQLTWLRHWPTGFEFKAENPNNLREMIALIGRIADNGHDFEPKALNKI